MATCMAPIEIGNIDNTFWTYIEYGSGLYRLSWKDSPCCPDLGTFPDLGTAGTVERLTISPEMEQSLQESKTIDYGADAWIRSAGLEIVKFAYPTSEARARIQREWKILRHMSALSLPVPVIQGKPLADGNGIFAFRMEKLYKWGETDNNVIRQEIHRFLKLLHDNNICHNDLRAENVMQTKEGQIVMIDFGRSGFIGEPIPSDLKVGALDTQLFTSTVDETTFAGSFTAPLLG